MTSLTVMWQMNSILSYFTCSEISCNSDVAEYESVRPEIIWTADQSNVLNIPEDIPLYQVMSAALDASTAEAGDEIEAYVMGEGTDDWHMF